MQSTTKVGGRRNEARLVTKVSTNSNQKLYEKVKIVKPLKNKGSVNRNSVNNMIKPETVHPISSLEKEHLAKVGFFKNLNLKYQSQKSAPNLHEVLKSSKINTNSLNLPNKHGSLRLKILPLITSFEQSKTQRGSSKVLPTLAMPLKKVQHSNKAIIGDNSFVNKRSQNQKLVNKEQKAFVVDQNQDFYDITTTKEMDKCNKIQQNTMRPLKKFSNRKGTNDDLQAKGVSVFSMKMDLKHESSHNIAIESMSLTDISSVNQKSSYEESKTSPHQIVLLDDNLNTHYSSRGILCKEFGIKQNVHTGNDENRITNLKGANESYSDEVTVGSLQILSNVQETNNDHKSEITTAMSHIKRFSACTVDDNNPMKNKAIRACSNECMSLLSDSDSEERRIFPQNKQLPALSKLKKNLDIGNLIDNPVKPVTNLNNDSSKKWSLYSGYSDDEDVHKSFRDAKSEKKTSNTVKSNDMGSKRRLGSKPIQTKHYSAAKKRHMSTRDFKSQKLYDPHTNDDKTTSRIASLENDDAKEMSCEYCILYFPSGKELIDHCKEFHSNSNLFF